MTIESGPSPWLPVWGSPELSSLTLHASVEPDKDSPSGHMPEWGRLWTQIPSVQKWTWSLNGTASVAGTTEGFKVCVLPQRHFITGTPQMTEGILTQIRAKLTTSRTAGSILAVASQPAKLKSPGSHLNQPHPLFPSDSFLSPQHHRVCASSSPPGLSWGSSQGITA